MSRKILPAVLLASLLTGCTGTFTNLTPTQQLRNTTGLYNVEVAFHSRQQTLKWDTIQPYVIVGRESYPMRQTPLMANRWEGLVPVAPEMDEVAYRYKLEFEYSDFGGRKSDSRVSREYLLKVLDQ